MTTTSLSLIDWVEERLAEVWLQMDHIGNARFQEAIEQVSHAFPVPENSPSALRVIRQAHDLFERVHTECVPEIQSRIGHQGVGCPIANRLGLTQGERPRQQDIRDGAGRSPQRLPSPSSTGQKATVLKVKRNGRRLSESGRTRGSDA